MPFYVGDYLADTGHLTTEEHGAYLLLLMQAWTRDGTLPADDDRLRALARMDRRGWARVRDTVLSFFVRDGDYLRNKRIDRERENVEKRVENLRSRGRAGAAVRWKKSNEIKAGPMLEPMLKQCQTIANHIHNHNIYQEGKPSCDQSAAKRNDFERDFETFWRAYPRRIGKGQARRAFASATRKASLETMLAALGRVRWPADKQRIPHPATWLNGERWHDDPTAIARDAVPRGRHADTAQDRMAEMFGEPSDPRDFGAVDVHGEEDRK